MKPSDVTLTIPTRGDIDLAPILDTLPDFAAVIVWDNSQRHDYGIFARYAAITLAPTEVIATQDDDLIVTGWDELLADYQPGVLVCNYPAPWDIPWVARGAVFDRDLPDRAFARYLDRFPFDKYFTHHACDGVFSLLTDDVRVVDYGSEDLPHGFANGRVSTTPGWYDLRRPLIQQRCQEVTVAHH